MTQPARSRLVPIDQIVSLLASQIDRLARDLLPDGKRERHEWVAPSRWGGSRRSLSVHLAGTKAGVWKDFATSDKGGDALDLVAQIVTGGDKAAAIRWAMAWLGLDVADPAVLERQRLAAEVARKRSSEAAKAEAERKRARAKAVWLEASELTGTPAEAYLAARGIVLSGLPQMPRALRFHPQAWCAEIQATLPAMVAAIGDRDGRHISTHFTYLARDAAGIWRKAKLEHAKISLGSFGGGFIRLTRGASARPWKDMRGSETVAIAEGIENALSVAVLVPEWRTAASISVGNMKSLELPATCRDVVICADNDAPDSAAAATLTAAAANLRAPGRRVRIARPDGGFKDWNDQLRAEQAEASRTGAA